MDPSPRMDERLRLVAESPREEDQVAEAYRAALVTDPHHPIKRLAEQYHASEATVRRWVQRPRDMDLLGESAPGRAGE